MIERKLSFQQAKEIPITEFLSGLGIEPAKIRGRDHWYYSPFREERTPSFKVNTNLNVWFDHGSGQGGTILNLGVKLHHCTISEFVEKLSSGKFSDVSRRLPKLPIQPDNKLEIISVKELISPDLIIYLKSRCIDISTAREYCKEVEFSIRQKLYTAIGFPNQSGAFELRNRWFKGSSSPKTISLLNNSSSKIAVLEGFMDFLSALKLDDNEFKKLTRNSDFLILNSLSLLNRSLPILTSHSEINLFLDNDLAAKEAKQSLIAQGIRFHDASLLYSSHKDVNEYLIMSTSNSQRIELPRTRSKGLRL